MQNADGQENWAQRLVRRVQSHPFLVVFFFASVLVSSFVVLSGAAISVHDWYEERFEWREREYKKLTSLRAGFSLAKFRETLGSPVFVRNGSELIPRFDGYRRNRLRRRIPRTWVESSFQGRDHWVQTVSDRNGIVLVYAVTSCDKRFTPTFVAPYGTFSVTLRKTRFDEVSDLREREASFAVHSLYFISGATASSYFFDIVYGGNPLDYKSFAWGLNDACPGWHPYYESLFNRGVLPLGKHDWQYHGQTNRGGRAIAAFRREAVVNTYAETAPAEFGVLEVPIHIGVDRLLVRTTHRTSSDGRT